MTATSINSYIQIHMSLEKKFHVNIFKIERSSDPQKVAFLGQKLYFFKLWSAGYLSKIIFRAKT